LAPNPYETLGVKQDATATEIRKAYRRLAKAFHPDVNRGDKKSEERFKRISAAYDLLSDTEKRARFDRGEIDASGAEGPRSRARRSAANGAAHPFAEAGGFGEAAGFSDADDIFAQMFGRSFRRTPRGANRRYQLDVDFLDAVNGAKRSIVLPDGARIDVNIPPGIRDRQVLRIRGKGEPGDGDAGDALIEIGVRPHPHFERRGGDIHVEVPITLKEAVLGAKIKAPTPAGPVTVTVPKGANTGTVLRLKGRGVRRKGGERGDEYVTLKVRLPDTRDPELEKFVTHWRPATSQDPRSELFYD
jgi:DnaJ-class molecular chaperone